MNSTSSTSGRIMYVDAEALYNALVETHVGRGRKDFAAVRVGTTRGSVIRSHGGLVARTRFACHSTTSGVLLLPPTARDVLQGLTGELEVEFEGAGDQQRVRILQGATCLLHHTVRDARLNTVSPAEVQIPTGSRIPGAPLAFALQQAATFIDPTSLRQPRHRAVHVGPMPGVEHGVVLARDDHGVIAIQLEGVTASLRLPLRHVDAIARFLRSRPTVMASSNGPRYFLVDDEGSGVGWTCDIEPEPMDTPPVWPTVGIDRQELLAAIDRLQTSPDVVVRLTTAPTERRMTLRHRGGEATEAVALRDGPSRAPASVCVRLTRLRRACDTASRELELFVCTTFVMTLERGLVSARGHLVRRQREDTVAVVAHRLVATMEPSALDNRTSPAEPAATDSPSTSRPVDSGEAVAHASAHEQVIEQNVSREVSEEPARDVRTPIGELLMEVRDRLMAFCADAEVDRGQLDPALATDAITLVGALAAWLRAQGEHSCAPHLSCLSRALEARADGNGAPSDPGAAAQTAAEALVSTESIGQLSMDELLRRAVLAEVLGAIRFVFDGLWGVDWDPGPIPGRLPEQLWALAASAGGEIDEPACRQAARAVPDPRLTGTPLASPILALELVATWLLHRGRLPVANVARADAEERAQRDALLNEIMGSLTC